MFVTSAYIDILSTYSAPWLDDCSLRCPFLVQFARQRLSNLWTRKLHSISWNGVRYSIVREVFVNIFCNSLTKQFPENVKSSSQIDENSSIFRHFVIHWCTHRARNQKLASAMHRHMRMMLKFIKWCGTLIVLEYRWCYRHFSANEPSQLCCIMLVFWVIMLEYHS